MVSSESAVKTCQDKLLFSRSLESSAIPPIDSSVELSQLNCNFFAVKERSGSASRSIGLNLVAKEAIEHAKGLDRPIFQPMIEGKEFSAETWINASGKCHGMLLRWRTKIIDGEAHQTETFENREWQKLLKSSFEAISGFSGHALAQVIVDPEQSLHLIEINLAWGEQALGSGSRLEFDRVVSSSVRQERKRNPREPKAEQKLKLRKVNGEAIIS